MKGSRKAALVVVGAVVAATIVFGVAAAAAPTAPKGPAVPAGSNQTVPNAGTGSSSNPPAQAESVYVPITDCRIVNTSLAGGKIHSGGTRSFYVVGSTGFTGQGGKSSGCGIPASATAVSARITALSESAKGAFIAYPTGTPVGQRTLYYAKGVSVNTGATLKLGPGTGRVLTVKDVAGPAQLVIDVNGYYNEQIEGMISPGATIYSGSNRLVSAVRNGVGNFTVTVDTDVTYCTPTVTAYSGYVYGSAYDFNNNKVQVFLWYLSGGTQTAYDGYFYLNVTC